MCFTNVNEAGIRDRYFMYSINKCTDFDKNITLLKKKKKSGVQCSNMGSLYTGKYRQNRTGAKKGSSICLQ